MARLLTAELGTRVRYEPRPADGLRELLRSRSQPEAAIEVALARDAATEAGENEYLTSSVAVLTGRDAAPLRDYLHRHRADYQAVA